MTSTSLFTIGSGDVFKGLVTAVAAAIITTLYGVITQADFNFFQADWAIIGSDVLKVAVTAFMAYLMKNFFSSESGHRGTETVVGVELEKES